MLLAEGHSNAYRYPLGRLQDEAEICRMRFRQQLSLKTDLFYHALNAALMRSSFGISEKDSKKINEDFRKLLTELYD